MWMPHLFCVGVAFPPPAAGSDVFAGFDGSGAGCAAEGWVTFIVESVIGYFVFFDHLTYGFHTGILEFYIDFVAEFCLVQEGVDFD